MFKPAMTAPRCETRTEGLFLSRRYLFCTNERICTMLPAALHSTTRESHAHFPAQEAAKRCVAQRISPAAKAALESVSVAAVERALCATGYPALRGVQIEIERGIVVLWGRVPNYHQKQLAQETAQRVEGVRGIANGIEVACRRAADQASSGSAALPAGIRQGARS